MKMLNREALKAWMSERMEMGRDMVTIKREAQQELAIRMETLLNIPSILLGRMSPRVKSLSLNTIFKEAGSDYPRRPSERSGSTN